MLHVALLEPEIAGNTGTIARTCLAAGAKLHLIHPLGFRLSDEALKRAGMDYWPLAEVELHRSYQTFHEHFATAFQDKRVFAFTTKGETPYTVPEYQAGDVLLFGPESRGLPASVRAQGVQLRIPIHAEVRSLNLAISVGIALYEAWRQLDFA